MKRPGWRRGQFTAWVLVADTVPRKTATKVWVCGVSIVRDMVARAVSRVYSNTVTAGRKTGITWAPQR